MPIFINGHRYSRRRSVIKDIMALLVRKQEEDDEKKMDSS
jgi:hypothetical protein